MNAMTRKVDIVTREEIPSPAHFPNDWRERIKADLERQVAGGAALYGWSDGVYIERTKDGDRVIPPPGD